jgi:hypothetical protein
MPGNYLAKMFVDKLMRSPFPAYFDRLTMKGGGLLEKAFKYVFNPDKVGHRSCL